MLMTESKNFCPSPFVRRTAALAFLACAASVHAQQVTVPSAPAPSTATLVAFDASPRPSLADSAGVAYSSSATSTSIDAVAPLTFAGVDATQPPPRRRYGRPRYNDSSHNPDGSSKYTGVVGVGLAQPVGNTYHYLSPSYGLQFGVGRNFDKNFSMIFQFDYDHFGFNGRTISDESYRFFGSQGVGLDGSSHIWSFSLNPLYNFYNTETTGAYVVGGVGFYHKVADFTLPQTGLYCDPYYGCQQVTSNSVFQGGQYISNAPGFSGGFGITYKPSRFNSEKLFAEVRYVYIDNQQRYGVTNANALVYNGNNYYPANSNRTSYIPVKFGLRF